MVTLAPESGKTLGILTLARSNENNETRGKTVQKGACVSESYSRTKRVRDGENERASGRKWVYM